MISHMCDCCKKTHFHSWTCERWSWIPNTGFAIETIEDIFQKNEIFLWFEWLRDRIMVASNVLNTWAWFSLNSRNICVARKATTEQRQRQHKKPDQFSLIDAFAAKYLKKETKRPEID